MRYHHSTQKMALESRDPDDQARRRSHATPDFKENSASNIPSFDGVTGGDWSVFGCAVSGLAPQYMERVVTKTLEEKGIEVTLRAESLALNAMELMRRSDQLKVVGELMKRGVCPSQIEKFQAIEPRGQACALVHTRVWLKGGAVKMLMDLDLRTMNGAS